VQQQIDGGAAQGPAVMMHGGQQGGGAPPGPGYGAPPQGVPQYK
jgi:hypothetical protein